MVKAVNDLRHGVSIQGKGFKDGGRCMVVEKSTTYAHRIAVITFALSANGEILMGSNPIVHKCFLRFLKHLKKDYSKKLKYFLVLEED